MVIVGKYLESYQIYNSHTQLISNKKLSSEQNKIRNSVLSHIFIASTLNYIL